MHVGTRLYNYVRAFLTNRTATVGISHLRTPSFPALHRGTPQGSVFSPLRFNITLKDLPPLLDTVPSLHHALYADDLTIWTNSGSMGEQQESLQRAIDITTIYLSECGKTCSPEKSALLTLQERTRGRHTAPTPDPALTIETRPVPVVTHLRVLGLTIPRDGSGSHTILALQRTVTQLAQLVKRITHQRTGLKEAETARLVQAFLICRLTYGAPYLSLKPTEHKKLDIKIRQPYKTALGLPTNTSTDLFLRLGIHNTWTELCEAQRTSQFQRLKLTPTGCSTLARLGYPTPTQPHRLARLPPTTRSN